MSSHIKLLNQILGGKSDAGISFEELCNFLKYFGFEERIKGSHHIFRKEGIEEKINLQKDGHEAKVYQVKQVRIVFLKYKLGGEQNV
jgi:predicted RNA binding protein YcfA (HicA-like mRNA interferase family)